MLLIVQVKLGIVCKVGVDVQRNVNLLIFEFWEFDYTHCTCMAKMGRPEKTEQFVTRKSATDSEETWDIIIHDVFSGVSIRRSLLYLRCGQLCEKV